MATQQNAVQTIEGMMEALSLERRQVSQVVAELERQLVQAKQEAATNEERARRAEKAAGRLEERLEAEHEANRILYDENQHLRALLGRHPVCEGCWLGGDECDPGPQCESCRHKGSRCVRKVCYAYVGCRAKKCPRVHAGEYQTEQRAWTLEDGPLPAMDHRRQVDVGLAGQDSGHAMEGV